MADSSPAFKISIFIARLQGQGNLALFARGASGSFLVRAAAAGLSFISAAVLTNAMGIAEYGDYAFAMIWINFLVLLGRLGYNRAAVRYIAEYAGTGRWDLLKGFLQHSRRRTTFSSSLITILTVIGLFVFRSRLEAAYGAAFVQTAFISASLLVMLSHMQVQEGLLDGFKKIIQSQLPFQVVRPALIALIVAVVAYGASGSMSAPLAMGVTVVVTAVVFVISYILVKRVVPAETSMATPMLRPVEWSVTSRDMMLATGFNLILMQADILMLGVLVDTTQSGIYQVASKVAGLLAIANVAANSILHPIVADLFARKKNDELQRIISIGANIVFVVGLISGTLLFIGADYILRVFGEGYEAAALPLRIFVVGVLFNLFTGPGLLMLNMTGYQRDGTIIMGISAGLNILLNALFIPRWGAFGAALATSITIVLWNIAAAASVWFRLRLISFAGRIVGFRRPPYQDGLPE